MYDTAHELGLVYSSDEVRQGESFEQEQKRKHYSQKQPDAKAVRRAETIEEKSERLLKVNDLLEANALSGKQRKKLLREQRGLLAALDSSTESVD